MPEKPEPTEQTQGPSPSQTTPKGLEIPVPTREEFLRNLGKVAPPAKREKPDPEPSEGRSADE